MSLIDLLWVNRYKPRKFSEIIGNRESIAQFRSWLERRLTGVPVKKASLLWGPPGTGKTLTVEVAALEYELELIQMNASDVRTGEHIKRVLGMASQYASLFGTRGKIILVDEVDGISRAEDRGGLSAIISLIDAARFPVVLTANDPWDPAFRPLRDKCRMIRYNRIRLPTLVAFLRKICSMEGIRAEDSALRFIARQVEGDVRSAVNDLQMMAQGRKTLTLDDVKWLAIRDRQFGVFDVLKGIFSAKTCRGARAAFAQSLVDYGMLLQWIHENLPLQYTSPEELVNAYDALSRADIFLGRAKRTQAWTLLSYAIDLMTAGVSMVKKDPYRFVKYRFPQKLKKLSQSREVRAVRTAVCRLIAEKCHISRRLASSEYLPYLKFIFENNVEMAAGIARWLHLDEFMIAFLAGNFEKAREIASHL